MKPIFRGGFREGWGGIRRRDRLGGEPRPRPSPGTHGERLETDEAHSVDTAWLDHVRDRVAHLPAKDIRILEPLDQGICRSSECGTIDQAAASIERQHRIPTRMGALNSLRRGRLIDINGSEP